MKIQLLSAIILSSLSSQVAAHPAAYWVDKNGDYAHDRNGHCVRTIEWAPGAAVAECEGGEAKTAVKAKSAPAPVKTAEPAAPVAAVAAAPTVEVFNLSSGATFESGGSALSNEGKAEIAALLAKFEGKTADAVVIEGHTDSSGDASFNQQLSEKRAEAVKAELVAKGASADKITTVGYGESKPVADNATTEGRAKNRRVEIKVEGVKNKQ